MMVQRFIERRSGGPYKINDLFRLFQVELEVFQEVFLRKVSVEILWIPVEGQCRIFSKIYTGDSFRGGKILRMGSCHLVVDLH